MRTKLVLAVCAIACFSTASAINAQNCGCGDSYAAAGASHCQGYTQAQAEQLWAGYCGENCWGYPNNVDLPQRNFFGGGHSGGFGRGCGLGHGHGRGCGLGHGHGFAHGHGFGHGHGGCWGRGGGGCLGKLFACKKGKGCGRGVSGFQGSGQAFAASSGTFAAPAVANSGCGGCGKCGKCLLRKIKRCRSGKIRCGRGAHAVGYTSAYSPAYIGSNACGALNRAGYGAAGNCCGTGIVSSHSNCGCSPATTHSSHDGHHHDNHNHDGHHHQVSPVEDANHAAPLMEEKNPETPQLSAPKPAGGSSSKGSSSKGSGTK